MLVSLHVNMFTWIICIGTQNHYYILNRNNTIAYILLILTPLPPSLTDPPSAPQKLRLSNISPFSVQLTWNPPMDANSYPDPTTYTVTLTNITDGTVLQYTLPSTQITLSNLLPGVQYNVSVYAKNTVGSGPPVTGVFRTNNSGEFS